MAEDDHRREYVLLLLDSVTADAAISTPSVAREPGIAPMYARRHRLMNMASDDQLLEWAAHPAPHIRATALEALLIRNRHESLDALLPQVLNDRSAVPFLQGDMLLEVPMLAYVYSYLLGQSIPGQAMPDGAQAPDTDYKVPSAWKRQAQNMLKAGAYTE